MRLVTGNVVAIVLLCLAAPSWAQEPRVVATNVTSSNGIASGDVSPGFGVPPSQIVFAAEAQGAATAPQERTYFVRLFGGLISPPGSNGLQVGGGIAGRPFGNDRMEVQGDVSYGRAGSSFGLGSASLWLVSGNLLYNFQIPDRNFTPYAGAGLAFVNSPGSFGGSDIKLQMLGGIEIPMNDRRAFRGEFRLIPTDTTISILGGISF